MFPHTFPACFLKVDLPPCWLQPASFYLCWFPLTRIRAGFGVPFMLLLHSHNFLWLAPAMLWKQWLNQTGTSWCAVAALPRALLAPPTDGLLRVIFLIFVLLRNPCQLPRNVVAESARVVSALLWCAGVCSQTLLQGHSAVTSRSGVNP